jgi:hypothetical protein
MAINSNFMRKTPSLGFDYILASRGQSVTKQIEKKPNEEYCQEQLEEAQLLAIDFHELFL